MERPKNRLSLKLGQRKLGFQQKPATNKLQEEQATQQVEFSSCSTATTKDESIESTGSTREIPPISGLCNVGNTCYVNCLLQPLRFCPQFSRWIKELHQLSEQVGAQYSGVDEAGKIVDTHSQDLDTTARPLTSSEVDKDEAMVHCGPSNQVKEKPSVILASQLHMVKVVNLGIYVWPQACDLRD